MGSTSTAGFLAGVRVLELANEMGEYCGKVLAGLGADVIKIEPVGGEETRGYGPFYHDVEDPDRSLYFWHYNFGKRGLVLDLDDDADRNEFLKLVDSADVLLDTRPRDYLSDRGLGYEQLRQRNRGLVYARISPFGDTGPWADYCAGDLVHLALGGVMMNCGYDPTPLGEYDTPPIAPQMWQAYHIAGEVTAIQILAALNYRIRTGVGQELSTSIHDAVSKNTETDLPDWIYARQPHARLTSRHSFAQLATADGSVAPGLSVNPNARTKDGRWLLAYRSYLEGFEGSIDGILSVLKKYASEDDLGDVRYQDPAAYKRPEVARHLQDVINRMVAGFTYDQDLWKDGQAQGLTWAPVRRPEENLGERHWAERETFFDVDYPELGETFTQPGAKWFAPEVPWRRGPRAPMLNEHRHEILSEVREPAPTRQENAGVSPTLSKHGKPFALQGVRVIDLSWMLASAGASRFFTAHGAEVIKVEHVSKVDGMRLGMGVPPEGGRVERERATAPLRTSRGDSLNRSGSFGEINAGKRSVSLNLKHPRAKELLTELLRDADVVVEGFSPGTMERMGFGYERLREINPRIIYVQQSGMGQHGTFGKLRSFGPTAQAFSGITEMSGLPEPYAPAGIGYSYLDWFGAYQMAAGMMAALYRQRQTGKGCWIDSSQTEAGLYLTGTAILDYTVNGRRWSRIGNRSPYKRAAPHGAYRAAGEDRWIAVSAFTQEQWEALARVLGEDSWMDDRRFATLAQRLENQDQLDELIGARILSWRAEELMEALQRAGVPAGVCQTAEDRAEHDPQLDHVGWLVELPQTEMGTWPVREVPVAFSETPPYIGGTLDRHGPNYAEDNDYVFGTLLGLSDEEIADLKEQGVS